MSSTVNELFRLKSNATAPATCGHAMLVPLRVDDAVGSTIDAELICAPGANMSTHVPQFEALYGADAGGRGEEEGQGGQSVSTFPCSPS